MKTTGFRNPKAVQGQSLIELAILLSLLLMLGLGVVDYARAIQFNNILVAMSREGANLASRTNETPQKIIKALNDTAEPLVMGVRGKVYITEIKGAKVDSNCKNSCALYLQVQAQTKATTGADLPSRVWTCPNSFLGDGSCNPVPVWNNKTADLPATHINGVVSPMTLKEGETVYAVETLYDYMVIVNYVMETGPKLYSLTVL